MNVKSDAYNANFFIFNPRPSSGCIRLSPIDMKIIMSRDKGTQVNESRGVSVIVASRYLQEVPRF